MVKVKRRNRALEQEVDHAVPGAQESGSNAGAP